MGFPIAGGSRDRQTREGAAIRRLRSAISGRHAPMARIALDVNGSVHTIDADPDMPLLYALR